MRVVWRVVGSAIATALLCAPAVAAPPEAPDCRNGLFPGDGVEPGLARIVGADKAFLREDSVFCQKDAKSCPVCPADAACQSKTYVIPADLVITAQSFGGYRCVLYYNRRSGQDYAGYVPEDRLEPQPAASLAQGDWTGTWRNGDNSIVLRDKAGKLSAKGDAYWPSKNPSRKAAPGGPHIGEMSGLAAPKGAKVAFEDSEGECHVDLTLLPPFLLAKDNGNCGGVNVSFNGVYTRAQPRTK